MMIWKICRGNTATKRHKTKYPSVFYIINKEDDKIFDFRPLHGLRHHYATMMASSGRVDLYTLQKLLNHKDPRMTQRYAHLLDKALHRGATTNQELLKDLTNKPSKIVSFT